MGPRRGRGQRARHHSSPNARRLLCFLLRLAAQFLPPILKHERALIGLPVWLAIIVSMAGVLLALVAFGRAAGLGVHEAGTAGGVATIVFELLFGGTVLLVSHDRAFLNEVATSLQIGRAHV